MFADVICQIMEHEDKQSLYSDWSFIYRLWNSIVFPIDHNVLY